MYRWRLGCNRDHVYVYICSAIYLMCKQPRRPAIYMYMYKRHTAPCSGEPHISTIEHARTLPTARLWTIPLYSDSWCSCRYICILLPANLATLTADRAAGDRWTEEAVHGTRQHRWVHYSGTLLSFREGGASRWSLQPLSTNMEKIACWTCVHCGCRFVHMYMDMFVDRCTHWF